MKIKRDNKVKILFFDFDGTISDVRQIAEDCLIEVFDEHGFKFNRKKAKKLLGSKMPEILKKLGLRLSFVDNARKKFYKKMIKKVKHWRIKLCVSVKPLWELKKKGYKFVVISNSETRFVKTSMRKLGINKLFGKVYGAEKFGTKDELLEKLFKKYKIRPHEAAYIGDRFSDIDYAREAGCWAIAIHNKCSWSSKKDVMKEKPDFMIRNFRELKKILETENF